MFASDWGNLVQFAPLHRKMENPPQCAQIAVYSDDGILRHVSPVPGIPAHQIARNL